MQACKLPFRCKCRKMKVNRYFIFCSSVFNNSPRTNRTICTCSNTPLKVSGAFDKELLNHAAFLGELWHFLLYLSLDRLWIMISNYTIYSDAENLMDLLWRTGLTAIVCCKCLNICSISFAWFSMSADLTLLVSSRDHGRESKRRTIWRQPVIAYSALVSEVVCAIRVN